MARRGRYHYDTDSPYHPDDAVRIKGHSGVAWYVLGWQTEPDEDTEWSGYENRTGQLVCCMVGDDAHWLIDPDDVQTLARGEYCGECGQIGCHRDGYSERRRNP